jgi:hypothetical protein
MDKQGNDLPTMNEPKPGLEYQLMRYIKGRQEIAKFLRFDDGSGMVQVAGMVSWFELDQTAWRQKWKELHDLGYRVIADDRLAGEQIKK